MFNLWITKYYNISTKTLRKKKRSHKPLISNKLHGIIVKPKILRIASKAHNAYKHTYNFNI